MPQPSEPADPSIRDDQGPYCYRDSMRPCNAGCMAYNAETLTDKDYVGKPWSKCIELVNGHRAAKHLVILTDIIRRNTNALPTPSMVR